MKSSIRQEQFKIPEDWELKAKLLRRRYPQLTASDVKIEDKEDESSLLKRIGSRLDKKSIEVIELIQNTIPNKFINNLKIHYHE